jgi:hypothetical protein
MMPYQSEQWRDFFVEVGSGSAALTGLVVVAMSMHLKIIMADPVVRNRARMILAGLAAVFIRCSLALMGGQDGRAVAIDLFVVCLFQAIMAIFSYAPVLETPTTHRSSFLRMIGGVACNTIEMLGAVLLFFGIVWGLNVAAIAMVASFSFMISGSWLLLLGIRQDDTPETAD